MGEKGLQTPGKKVLLWVRKQSKKVKTVIGFVTCLTLLLTLRLLIHDHNHFFVLAELIHFIGLLCLIYKLSTIKTCSGLSLKTQVLTAIFLAVRVFCSFIMEGDIHTILDFVTLVATLWVIYMMKFKLKSSYMADLDTMHNWYLVYDTSGAYLLLAGRGYFWIPMVFLAEIVQTFILADFCYYYIKSVISGQLLVRLPQPV